MFERSERYTRAEPSNPRLRFELTLASVLLAVGLFIMPGLIYWVGIVVLGPYGEGVGAGVGSFYADFFGDLASAQLHTWALALGPLILVSLIRFIFWGVHETEDAAAADENEPDAASPRKRHGKAPRPLRQTRRVEPHIGE